MDVMSGEMLPDEIQEAKKIILNEEAAVEIDEVKLEARKAAKEKRDAAERERRRLMEAEARYTSMNVDPFGKHSQAGIKKKKRGARMIFGKYKGTLVEDLPTWYIDSCLRGQPFISVAWLRNAMVKERNRR